MIAILDHAGKDAARHSQQGDQAGGVGLQEPPVQHGIGAAAGHVGQGNQPRQIGVALAGLRDEGNRAVALRFAHNEINADDGMDAGGEALLAELQRAAQVGHVGQTQGGITVGESGGHHVRG